MSRKQTLPYDVRLECIAYVRGYPRRVQAYNDARSEILSGGNSATEGMPRSPGIGRPAESKAEQLAAIENWPETKKMRAVEYAIDRCGRDLESESVRKQLTQGIMRNCQGKHERDCQNLAEQNAHRTSISLPELHKVKNRYSTWEPDL